jgi:hypothetical protein
MQTREGMVIVTSALKPLKIIMKFLIGIILLFTPYSQYCGNGCCKNCRYKERPFPKMNLGNSSRGDICIVCDRKFYIREMIKESA